jgi:hypothetical protein
MKTSTRLSLRFTLITIAVVGFFAVVVNILFFSNRYRSERALLLSENHPSSTAINPKYG